MCFAKPTSVISGCFRNSSLMPFSTCLPSRMSSIDGPSQFIETNVEGTFALLEAALTYWQRLPLERAGRFRFHHVSTDEVFGSLGPIGKFHEITRYAPNSSYSGSKAASDHLVRGGEGPLTCRRCSATVRLRTLSFPGKANPADDMKVVRAEPIPVYGKGNSIRDWLHVEDDARVLFNVLSKAQVGEHSNIGGDPERTNLDVVTSICRLLDEMLPTSPNRPHESLTTFVTDRPGHDCRYAMIPRRSAANWAGAARDL
jgi:dTDP-glucose 4,6-dehydratase